MVSGCTTRAKPNKFGHSRVIQSNNARSVLCRKNRGGARLKAMPSWWRRNKFSA
jgi:hypothetical protein